VDRGFVDDDSGSELQAGWGFIEGKRQGSTNPAIFVTTMDRWKHKLHENCKTYE
jgi:hypothetical protein